MAKQAYSLAKQNLSAALNADGSGKFHEAIRLYRVAVTHFDTVIRLSSDTTILTQSRKFRSDVIERIKVLENKIGTTTTSRPEGSSQPTSSMIIGHIARILPSKDTVVQALKNLSSKAVERVLGEVVERSSITFADIVGNERAKQILNEIMILPMLRPELFTGLRAPARGVLLFGPPGNGKTMIAKAVASESNCFFFSMSGAAIFSKWVGESENLVRALFAVARYVQPAVIFLDEVDSLMCARETGRGQEVSRRVLTQLLAEMDGIGSGSDRILVLAATNRPQELDDAALRRLSRRVYIRMPDTNDRFNLLKKFLDSGTPHTLTQNDIRKIASFTEGYSASDLKELAKEAALGPIRELSASKLQTIDAREVRPLGLKDFVTSSRSIRPSGSRDKLAFYDAWNSRFGDSSAVPNAGTSFFGNKLNTCSLNLLR